MNNPTIKRYLKSPSRLLFFAIIFVFALGLMGVLPLEKDCAKLGWPAGCDSPHEPPNTLGVIWMWSWPLLILVALMESSYKKYKPSGRGHIGLIKGFITFAVIIGGLYIAILAGNT